MAVLVPPSSRGPSMFAGWQAMLGETIDVTAVQLPGREERALEPPATSVAEVAIAVVDAIARLPAPAVVVVGACSGANIALEVAAEIEHRQLEIPCVIVAASSRPPHLLEQADDETQAQGRQLLSMSDEELLRELLDLQQGGDLPPMDAESQSGALNSFRAVVRMTCEYRFTRRPLSSALVTWRGRDDPLVTSEHARQWSRYGAGTVEHLEFPGFREYFEHPDHAAVTTIPRMLKSLSGAGVRGSVPSP
jgi:medium-chain acyl-[acyl-carrier-protein] hydrolase